jgi:Protein of unknown function (DUF1592)/Protein of unknown function (DUF1588)
MLDYGIDEMSATDSIATRRPAIGHVGLICVQLLSSTVLFSCQHGDETAGRIQADGAVEHAASDSGSCLSAASCLPPAVRDAGSTVCPSNNAAIAPASVLAMRLVRFLWNENAASAELQAEVNGVVSAGQMKDIAIRMMADPRARVGIAAFFSSWLRLNDLDTIIKPGTVMTRELVVSMQREAPAFGVSVVLDGDGRYKTLMSAPFTFVDETLAAHYGIAGVSGTEMRMAPYPTVGRIGILEGAGVLARYSGSLEPPWPPRRFWLIYEAMLCDSDALPPAIQNSGRTAGLTIRDDLLTRTSGAPCNACHMTVNPVGLAFSSFDTFGRYETLDANSAPLQTAGAIPGGLAVRAGLEVADGSDLIQQLAARPEVRRCFAARMLDYALNPVSRPASYSVNLLPLELQCSLDQAHATFEASGGDIRELIAAITATQAFVTQ